MTLEPGRRLGEWVLEAPLGRGGHAEVWRARHNALPDRVAAVKVPHDPTWGARLETEGVLLQRVSGPHVVPILGLDPEHDPPYLVMDLVDGASLRDTIARGPVEPREALRLLRQVVVALQDAHGHGVVHRDLKPENVLVDRAGRVLVSDFGLGLLVAKDARALLESGSLRTTDGHDLAGTLRYMAPEQRDPDATVDARADLYALGVILFELLTAEAPSGAEVPSDVVPGLDQRLDGLYRHLCARQASRCPSAEHALADLDALLDLRPTSPGAPPRSVDIPAGLAWRGAATLLDVLPFALLALGPLRNGRGVILAMLGYVLADAVITGLFGRTPGRALLRLRLARPDGARADGAQRFQRQALRLLSGALLGLGYLPALLSPGKRALHDLLSDTQVVHEV